MNKYDEYEKIKDELLSDDNIFKVAIDVPREELIVTPNLDKEYAWMEEPLEGFKDRGRIRICDKIFNVVSYLENMGQVYELVLKEY